MEVLKSSSPAIDILGVCLSILCWSSFLILDIVIGISRQINSPLIWLYWVFNFVVFFGLQPLLTIVHEKAHAFAASHFSFKTNISYFHKNKNGYKTFKPCCMFEKSDEIGKSAFIVIALAPAIGLSLIFLPFVLFSKMFLSYYPELFCFGVPLYLLKLKGCFGDLNLVLGASKKPKGTTFQQLCIGDFKVIKK
ncbi:DUF3267 domain-containing protein [Bacillus amyloliquefaciens]|uniref:DUF3267 domain-containing protein n=1 Tax=Bacillus amyloliquefaciens TaxID=1390 RepID=UPI002D7E3076|nr:DUF3267 domain-containing protein [Bacillus amyloliquefaciens]MEB4593922.1 DUF3267 domain-containing protein [Bacillus amyloliquefaciens]